MPEYIIWNPDKIAMESTESLDFSLYSSLLAVEEATGFSWSSSITVAEGTIDSVINGVLNEADCTLEYHKVGNTCLVKRQRLLSMIECRIDTAARTTDLESVYDDSLEQSVPWTEVYKMYAAEVYKMYAAVKRWAGVE